MTIRREPQREYASESRRAAAGGKGKGEREYLSREKKKDHPCRAIQRGEGLRVKKKAPKEAVTIGRGKDYQRRSRERWKKKKNAGETEKGALSREKCR